MARQAGFTLIELAVVLVIVGMLLAGALQAIQVLGEAQRVRDTRSELAEIREALLGFAVRNGHLPCPADPAATGAAIGVEDRSGDVCNRLQGLLPWVALGLGQVDAFGRPFSYRVTGFYADADGSSFGGCGGNPPPPGVSFAMCSLGDINILSAAVSGRDLARNAVAVVISHGSYGPGPLQAGARATRPQMPMTIARLSVVNAKMPLTAWPCTTT